MRVLAWAIRIALFVVLLAFAARNTDSVTLRFYFDLAWQAPLVVVLLAFFVGGVALGIAAMVGTLLSQRRDIARLEKRLALQEPKAPAAQQPPAAEG